MMGYRWFMMLRIVDRCTISHGNPWRLQSTDWRTWLTWSHGVSSPSNDCHGEKCQGPLTPVVQRGKVAGLDSLAGRTWIYSALLPECCECLCCTVRRPNTGVDPGFSYPDDNLRAMSYEQLQSVLSLGSLVSIKHHDYCITIISHHQASAIIKHHQPSFLSRRIQHY